MKILSLLTIAFFISGLVQSQTVQKIEEYTASNGITYKIGDQIKLGRGSDPTGKFIYVTMGGWASNVLSIEEEHPNQGKLGPANSGMLVTIKKIKKYDKKRNKEVYFSIGGGNITNYLLDIENAIRTCEVENCTGDVQKVEIMGGTPDKYDQLAKLKKLLDDGILTQEEYEIEKKKLLEQAEK